ncbi:neuraminidase-like domain-containing protein [Mycolicibacterium sp.]|uniref:neuraminidase-like domain-containing protein n=1 Tax=Mycolicibacterium sp. TaxID=2320850 RepID=UPI0028A8A781|nr:neuraminidase-like domain-containing protein [Mycolicibacterium sp.]
MAEFSGQIRIANGLPAKGEKFQLLRERVGGDPEVIATLETNESGQFTSGDIAVDPGATLVARIQRDGADDVVLAPLTAAQDPSAMRLVLPESHADIASEFSRLTEAVRPTLGGIPLAQATESSARHDLSVIQRETSWDARLLALSVYSARLSTAAEGPPAIGMSEEAIYGLLRSGLPSDRDLLARVPAATVHAALDKSAGAGVISLDQAARDEQVAAFQAFATEQRLAARPGGGVSTLRELLEVSGLPADGDDSPRQRFEKVVLDSNTDEPLWTRATNAGLNDEQISTLKSQARLAFLTTNNVSLMTHVEADVDPAASFGQGLTAAGWDNPGKWSTALTALGGAAVVPAAFRDDDDPVGAYSFELARKVRVAYPTQVVAAMVQRGEVAPLGEPAADAKVAAALLRAGEHGLQLGATNMKTLLDEHPDVLDGVDEADRGPVTSALATLQRVYQLSPSNEAMKVLLDHKLTSAYDIAALTEPVFIDRYGPLFPSEREARLVFRKSEQIQAVLYTFYSMTKQAADAPALATVSGTAEQRQQAVDNIKRVLPTTPTMESLFGSMDYCECDHCRSVLGPAAYVVDVLKFLDPDPLAWEGFKSNWANRHNGDEYPFGTPYEELVARRPDLAHLQLSCENTNTELPVIDVVNEILEYLVVAKSLSPSTVRDSGAVESQDVMAEPEFVVDNAYTQLRAATFPSLLPFDLWHETIREFLGWLGEPLSSLLGVYPVFADAADDRYAAAIERLGLTRAAAEVLTDDDPLTNWWTRLGFGSDPGQEAGARETLQRAKQLARRLGVSYQQLADLLGTHFINPALDELGLLDTAGVSVADAILWHANQPMIDGDEPTDPDEHEIWLQVQSVQQRLTTVTTTYGLTGDRTAEAWLRAIDADALADVIVLLDPDASCDFDRTLLGSAATGAVLDGDRQAEIVVKLDLFVRLQRATDWAIADLDEALRVLVPGGTAGTNLFGAPMRTALVYLAHITELSTLLDTDDTTRRRWVSAWSTIGTHGASSLYTEMFQKRAVGQRDPSFAAPLGDPLSEDAVGADVLFSAHATTLCGALGVRVSDLQAIVDRSGDAWSTTRLSLESVSDAHRYTFLAQALDSTVADVLALERLSTLSPFQSLAAEPLAADVVDQPLQSTLPFVNAAIKIAKAGLTIAELDYALAHRVDPINDLRPNADVTSALLEGIKAKLTESLARLNAAPADAEPDPDAQPPMPPPTPAEIAASLVATAMGPRAGVTAALLDGDDALQDPSGPAGTRLVEAFLSLADPAADPERCRRAHLLLTKVLMLSDRFDLSARECSEFGLGALPLGPDDDTKDRFDAVLRLIDYTMLRKEVKAKSDALIGVLAAARGGAAGADLLGAAINALAAVTKRRPEPVRATVETLGLSAEDLGALDGIRRVWRVLALIERLGVDAATVAGWCKIVDPATTVADRSRIAREVKDAVRAHLGPVRWRQVAKPISDRLRQRQRDALVAAVLHDTGLTSVDELYQWLLIDPGSEPVLRTTRIRQAMSSLQLFVQRCLLNIEPRVHPSAINAHHWEWMKRYRVWEANRKIFLYPENWLEPEFRDDKSHLFTELEGTLLQSDVSADVVEDAFLVYLRKLDEIARLDVVGFYTEQDFLDPGSTTLHVIGRTHGQPHQYFYRRLQHGIWTAWEPMGIDIEGDHIVPVVWRNRLHVFWVTFLQKSDDSDSNPESDRSDITAISRQSLGVAALAQDGNFQLGGSGSAPKKQKALAEATADEVQGQVGKRGVGRRVDVQLHWSEYVRGKWSPTTSGGFGRVPALFTNSVFDPASVFVHTSTLWNQDQGEEAGVQIHLTGAMTQTFLLRGRNSPVERGKASQRPPIPYKPATAEINRYRGSGSLTVEFTQKFTSVNGGAQTPTKSTLGILAKCGSFTVLPSANGIAVGAGDIGSLVSAFFFQDANRTFFVEPSLLETTTESWEEWIVPDSDPGVSFDPGDIDDRIVVPFIPRKELQVPDRINPGNPLLDPWPELATVRPTDMITSPDVAVLFDNTVLGSRGGLDLTVVTPHAGAAGAVKRFNVNDLGQQGAISVVGGVGDVVADGGIRDVVIDGGVRNVVVDAHDAPGLPDLAPDRVVLVDHDALSNAGLALDATKIHVLANAGIGNRRIDAGALRVFGR